MSHMHGVLEPDSGLPSVITWGVSIVLPECESMSRGAQHNNNASMEIGECAMCMETEGVRNIEPAYLYLCSGTLARQPICRRKVV